MNNIGKDSGLTEAMDGFSIVVNQDGTLNLDDSAVSTPETEEPKPIVQLMRNAGNRDKKTATSVIVISNGSLVMRKCDWEDGEWVCRNKTIDLDF